jgi:hypothetical protein
LGFVKADSPTLLSPRVRVLEDNRTALRIWIAAEGLFSLDDDGIERLTNMSIAPRPSATTCSAASDGRPP